MEWTQEKRLQAIREIVQHTISPRNDSHSLVLLRSICLLAEGSGKRINDKIKLLEDCGVTIHRESSSLEEETLYAIGYEREPEQFGMVFGPDTLEKCQGFPSEEGALLFMCKDDDLRAVAQFKEGEWDTIDT